MNGKLSALLACIALASPAGAQAPTLDGDLAWYRSTPWYRLDAVTPAGERAELACVLMSTARSIDALVERMAVMRTASCT